MRISINNQNVFFASDLHLYHANVIKFDGRPFKNVEEMHQVIIKNWNAKVKPTDKVFYLGDLSFGDNEKTKNLISQLNGEIYYVLGNHDKIEDIESMGRFKCVEDYIHLSILDTDNPKKWQTIMLFHYAILQWDKAHHSSWHLHGHSHGALTKDKEYNWYYNYKVIDVGCNMWNYTPLSYQEVKDIMKKREIKGHH